MIEGVAIKIGDQIISLAKPNRHHHVINYAVETLGINPPIVGIQGFYTDKGIFLDRTEAKIYSGLTDTIHKTLLFSEDLW